MFADVIIIKLNEKSNYRVQEIFPGPNCQTYCWRNNLCFGGTTYLEEQIYIPIFKIAPKAIQNSFIVWDIPVITNARNKANKRLKPTNNERPRARIKGVSAFRTEIVHRARKTRLLRCETSNDVSQIWLRASPILVVWVIVPCNY